MILLNSPKGLGDAIYARAIVLHLLAREQAVKVFTFWPEVFWKLPIEIAGANDYSAADDLHHAMACLHCRVPSIMALDRFTLTCLQAQVTERVDLRLQWQPGNETLLSDIRRRAAGRSILLYQPPKISKDTDQELTRPRWAAFKTLIEQQEGLFRIKIGSPRFVSEQDDLPCELDLFGKTSVRDVFDVATICDVIFGEAPCFLPNLAEAMDKPFTCMFSRRGMEAVSRKRVWRMRPDFLLHKKHLATVVYDD